MNHTACPCGLGQSYEACCQPAHLGERAPQTAEALMRSRYSAYALGITDYLVTTTHPKSRSRDLRTQIESSHKTTQWLGLSIQSVQNGGAQDKVGKVAFIARFKQQGAENSLHELSRFCRYQGDWVYLDGKVD